MSAGKAAASKLAGAVPEVANVCDAGQVKTPEGKRAKIDGTPSGSEGASQPLFDAGAVSPNGIQQMAVAGVAATGMATAKTPEAGGQSFALNVDPFTPGVVLGTPNGMSLNANEFDPDIAGLLPTGGTPHTPQGQAIPDTTQNDIVSQLLLLSQGNTPKVGSSAHLPLGSPTIGTDPTAPSSGSNLLSTGPSASGNFLDQIKHNPALFPGLSVDINKPALGNAGSAPRQPVFSPAVGATGASDASASSKHTTPASAQPTGTGTVAGASGGSKNKPTDKRSNKRKRSEYECKLDSLDHVRIRFPNHAKRAWECTNCEPVRTIKTYDWVAKCVHCKHCRRCNMLICTSHHAVCPFCEKG